MKKYVIILSVLCTFICVISQTSPYPYLKYDTSIRPKSSVSVKTSQLVGTCWVLTDPLNKEHMTLYKKFTTNNIVDSIVVDDGVCKIKKYPYYISDKRPNYTFVFGEETFGLFHQELVGTEQYGSFVVHLNQRDSILYDETIANFTDTTLHLFSPASFFIDKGDTVFWGSRARTLHYKRVFVE